jgi:PAS domain-containing protein
VDPNLSDRRRVEQALEASEARLRHIVEHAKDLLYYCDTKWALHYVNPRPRVMIRRARAD